MRKLLLGTMIFCGLIAMAGFEDQVAAGIIDNTQPIVPNRAELLVDTRAGVDAPAFAVVSTAFTDDVLSGFQTAGADDFTVPSTDCGWEITTIRAYGRYSNPVAPGGPFGPATSLRVYILPKTGATPDPDLAGTAIWFDENITSYTELDPIDGGDFEVDLPNLVLPEGDYWLVVQANMALFAVGQWNWTESSLTPNSGTTNGDESAWFQSAGGVTSPITGNLECVGAWGTRVTGCSMSRNPDTNPPLDRDFAFQIEGNNLAPGVTIAPMAFTTTEDGAAVTYSVVLDAPPTPGETVTVTPGSNDATEGTVSGALTFDGTDWNVAQDVTITPGASGDGNDGDVAFTVTNAVTSDTPSGCYDGPTAANVAVTNVNIDGIRVVTIDPISGLTISEDGAVTQVVTIAAGTDIPPTADVSVTITDAAGLVTSDTSPVVLTAANTYSATLTLTGVADNVVEASEAFTIITGDSTSADAGYNGIVISDITGTLTDDNTASVTVTPARTPLETDESGGTDNIGYVLTAQPTADVTFSLSVDDPNEASVLPASLTFTNANWNMTQTATVTGEDDDVADGPNPQDFNVIATSTTSTDPFWDAITVASAAGENDDDGDAAGVTLNDGGGVVTDETGLVDSFSVALDSEPIFDVSVDFRSDDTTEGLVGTAVGGPFSETTTLTFTPANWDTAQSVFVEGQDDDIRDDGNIAFNIISENAVSGDADYRDIVIADIAAVNNDDNSDIPGITVAPATLTLQEDGASADFTARLDSQPTVATVTVPVASGDTTEATVLPASLTFTDANWATPQSVTVTPVEDFEIDDNITFNVSLGPATGGNYTGETASVSVTVENVDTCGPMTLVVEVGESIVVFGSPTCVFDLYNTFGSSDTDDWALLGTFEVGAGGSVDTRIIGEADGIYVTTVEDTVIVLTDRPYATVPTLGEWGMIAFIALLALCGLVVSRRRAALN